jgi:hypothetical protein
MGIRKNNCEREWGKVLDIIGKVIGGWAASHTYCFSLAVLLKVAMFALF